jgi:phage shock protein C
MDNPTEKPIKKLYRSTTDRVFAGVCGGLGDYFGLDAIIFRAIFVILTFSGGAGLVLYIILALVVPREDRLSSLSGQPNMENLAQEMGERTRNLAEEMRAQGWLSEKRNVIGLVIVAFGVLILFDRLSPVHWLRWEIIWPVIIIFLGVLLLTSKKRK